VSPGVSVIIPAFRAEPFIDQTVRSVLAQSRGDFEVVIASDDGIDYGRLLRKRGLSDARVRCVSTGGVGTGAASARNAALAAASARIVASLDADDALDPRALEILAPLAMHHGAAYCRPRLVDGTGGEELPCLDRRLPPGPVELQEVLTSQVHTYAGLVFDRERVQAEWPAWMERWEDVFFYVKCFDRLERMYHVSEPLYTYRRTAGSICNRPEAGGEFLAWAALLAGRIERGETLGLENAGSRETFRRFLRGRATLEQAFAAAMEGGLCDSYHGFVTQRLDLFYALDAAA
jgi:succinoglycan biosynthesis protein ExoO